MDAPETQDFAMRLMRDVWIPFAYDQVPRFYNRDVVGHHRGQTLNYDDVVTRLSSDHQRVTQTPFTTSGILSPRRTNSPSASSSRRRQTRPENR
jgi:hypothetical protein